MVLNTHRVLWLGYFLHRWVYVRDTTHFKEVFLKNGTTDIEEFNQKWYLLLRILLNIKKHMEYSEQKQVRPDIFGICPRTQVWLNVRLNWKQFRHTFRLQSGCISIRVWTDENNHHLFLTRMARLAYYLKMTRFKWNLLEESDLDQRCLLKGDSNPNDKYVLSERAVWTMNFDTIIIKIGLKMGKLWAFKEFNMANI